MPFPSRRHAFKNGLLNLSIIQDWSSTGAPLNAAAPFPFFTNAVAPKAHEALACCATPAQNCIGPLQWCRQQQSHSGDHQNWLLLQWCQHLGKHQNQPQADPKQLALLKKGCEEKTNRNAPLALRKRSSIANLCVNWHAMRRKVTKVWQVQNSCMNLAAGTSLPPSN